jgi:hypothetical protein
VYGAIRDQLIEVLVDLGDAVRQPPILMAFTGVLVLIGARLLANVVT